MSGDSSNASVWADADVYIAPVGSAIPANVGAAFGVAWSLVGLLEGSDGFEYSRSEDVKDHSAWGVGVIKSTRKNHKSMYKFSALEDNAVTRSLVWPGSTAAEYKVPVPVPMMIAFETTTGGKTKRLISRAHVDIALNGSVKDNEEDLTKRTFDVTVYPDSNNVLFDVQSVPDIASIAITALTLALSLAGAKIKTIVATATYTDASTGVVTDSATWITSDAAKATVSRGYVTGVATGTADISCELGGITSTAPCVVTVSS